MKTLLALFLISFSACSFSDSFLMPQQEYIEKCMQTYGDDPVTYSVCESQYQKLIDKEASLITQSQEKIDTAKNIDVEQKQESKD